jgi:hypothetical protein
VERRQHAARATLPTNGSSCPPILAAPAAQFAALCGGAEESSIPSPS